MCRILCNEVKFWLSYSLLSDCFSGKVKDTLLTTTVSA